MAQLDKTIQERIDELSNQAYEKFQSNDTDESFRLLKEAWHLYPDPKDQWGEAYNNAKYLFEDYIRIEDYQNAQEWLNKMISHNNARHLFDGDITFNQGKYYFETGDYKTALEKWQQVVKDTGLRYFENEKNEYLHFYNNPDSLIK